MKEKEFMKRIKEQGFRDATIRTGVYWQISEEGNVIIDAEGMSDEMKNIIKELEEISNEK